MTKKDNLYLADENKVFKRISDGFIMGWGMDLGVDDDINNYEEIDAPEGYIDKRIKEINYNIKND